MSGKSAVLFVLALVVGLFVCNYCTTGSNPVKNLFVEPEPVVQVVVVTSTPGPEQTPGAVLPTETAVPNFGTGNATPTPLVGSDVSQNQAQTSEAMGLLEEIVENGPEYANTVMSHLPAEILSQLQAVIDEGTDDIGNTLALIYTYRVQIRAALDEAAGHSAATRAAPATATPVPESADSGTGVCRVQIWSSISALPAGRMFQIGVNSSGEECNDPVVRLSLRFANGEEVLLGEHSGTELVLDWQSNEALRPQVLTFIAEVRPFLGNFSGSVSVPVEIVVDRRLGGRIESEWVWMGLGTAAPSLTAPSTPTAIPDSTPESTCRSSRGIITGLQTQIDDTKPDAARVREQSRIGAPIVATLPVRTPVTVLAGPQCADGHVWWQVQSGEMIGWTAEINLPFQTGLLPADQSA